MTDIPVLVLDGESGFATSVVRSLAIARRWKIHLLAKPAGPNQRPAISWSRHVSSVHRLASDADDQTTLARIAEVVRETGSQVIIPIVEATSLFCIRHRETLTQIAKLAPLASADSFTTAIDKGLLGLFMARHGLPHPRSYLPDGNLAELNYPLLIKPRRACGGAGIVKVTSPEALHQELARHPHEGDVCVQEFVEGYDLDCSVLVREGEILAWTTQRGLHRDDAFARFSEIEMEPHPDAVEVVARLMRALNWSGIANVDLLVDSRTGKNYILEINGRYWASLWASTMADVNFPDMVCRAALGESLPTMRQKPGRFMELPTAIRDIVRLRWRFRSLPWTNVLAILNDPVPTVVAFWRLGWNKLL